MDSQVVDAMGLRLAAVIPLAVSFVPGAIDPAFGVIDEELQVGTWAEIFFPVRGGSPVVAIQTLMPGSILGGYHFSGIALQIGIESFGSKGAGEQDV
ncbi:MAG: hypothetical protein AAF921_28140 [Cyanobacteria bacterium P01_D01_bin.44]